MTRTYSGMRLSALFALAILGASSLASPAAAVLPSTAARWTPNDPLFAEQWSFDHSGDVDVDAPEAWALLRERGVRREVIVAVVDSGFNLNHEDLKDALWVNQLEQDGQPGIDDDGNGYIDDVHGYDFVSRDPYPVGGDHGTNVAGVIGATADNGVGIAGLAAPAGVRLMLLRHGAANVSGKADTAIEAWEYARSMGAEVVNNSWGTFTTLAYLVPGQLDSGPGAMLHLDAGLKAKAEELSRDGIVQVFAGGYGGPLWPDVWDDYNLPGVLRVSAGSRSDTPTIDLRPHPLFADVLSPTGELWTTTGNGGYSNTFGATSGAAPHAAATAALIRALYGPDQLSNAQVAQAVMDGVDVLPQYAFASRSGGRLSAHGALLAAERLAAGCTNGRPLLPCLQ